MPTTGERDFTYSQIMVRLDINEKFLAKHNKIINERFETAGAEILMGLESKLENADITGINKCLQLASTILLLGTNSENIKKELDDVASENDVSNISGIDPSTILTIAILYHLITLKENEYGTPDKQKTIKAIKDRFSKIKWLIGEEWIEKLKIE